MGHVRLPAILRRSLRARLVGSFLLLGVLAVAGLGLLVNARATEDLRTAVADRLAAASGLKVEAVERWLDEQRRNVVFVAGLLGQANPGESDPVRTFLMDDGTPDEVAAAREAIASTLDYVVRQSTDAQELLVLDGDGLVRISTFAAHEGITQADEAYFQRGRSGTTIEGVFRWSVTDAPTIAVATPLFAANGQRAGVMVAVLDLVRLDRILLERTGLGDTGQTFLVSADGTPVSGIQSGQAAGPITSDGIAAALDGSEGQSLYTNHRGLAVIGAWQPVPEIGSALVAEMTQEEAFAPARELAGLIAIAGLAAIVLLAAGIALVARAITRPILGLAATADRVSAGDLDATAPVTSEDEVGSLSQAFNAMTGQLRENVATLERRVAERTAELQEAEARYRKLVEELPLTLYIDRPDEMAASVYVSPMIEPMFGYAPDAWAADDFFPSVLHPDDRDRVMADHTAAFERGDDRWGWDYRIIAADGRTVWVHDEAMVVKDGHGVPQYVQGLLQDVTGPTLAAAEVRRQKQYFEALVEASPVAIVVMDRDEIVTAWNPAAVRLFGYEVDEAIGRHIDELIFAPEERTEGAQTTRAAREEGRAQRIGRRMRRDGSHVDVEIVVVPLRLDGEHVGYYAIYHDISELEEARHAAETANQAKSAFLAAMSHEIRTPMNAIIGMSGLLVDTELAGEQREYAETIRVSGEALLTIINDILDFSKIEAGRVELESVPFSLPRVVEGALDVLAPSAAAKGIELAYAAAPDLPAGILGDPGRVRQVVLNLLSNAMKFTEAGEVVLTVAAARAPDARWEVTIEVRDTGIGIPAERVDRLFQSFSQVDASISRRFGGTGLGLAISRRLAELMDGSLTAESAGVPGEGSTFRLRFLAAEAEAPEAPAPARSADVVAGRRALIVDDNATNRRILEAQVTRWRMSARVTESGAEALGWVRDGEAFDIALLDFHMPDLDGAVLAARLRELRPTTPIPVVILSSVGGAGDRADPSIVATLTKPVKPSALFDAVADALGEAPAATPERRASEEPERIADAHPLRILLAEDNAMNRRLALILLDRMGYTADVAVNGLEAIEAIERATYDVVLMDVQMPELDGLEATRRIRARWADGERPRIVALTANAMAEDRAATAAAGMDDYLSKPIRPAELADALRRITPRADA